MNTGSTKFRDRNAAEMGRESTGIVESQGEAGTLVISPLAWRIASLTILAGSAFIRVYQLGLKPMHHDEGVNGYFLTNLYRTGVYHYDPANYHGPTLYYFALILTKLNGLLFGSSAGLSTVAVRLVPVIFGVATVWLVLGLRRNIGTLGALLAAALVAVSPGHVFISRYFIHETHFVFFALALVVAALRYYESADPLYLLLASLSAAFVFATKETAFISAGVLVLAIALASGYVWFIGARTSDPPLEKRAAKKKRKQQRNKPRVWQRFGGLPRVMIWSGVALALFVFINILFYSSFFTYWKGVNGALESLQVWAKTSGSDHTQAGILGYVEWLMQEEAPILIIGTMGALIALVRGKNRFAIFAGAWAFGIFAAYSLIPYKTPWLMLNFIVPLAIAAGYAINEIYTFDNDKVLRVVSITIATIALGVLLMQSVVLNFYRYDDDKYPYVYAHTTRNFLVLIGRVEDLANRTSTGKATGITIMSPDYWPMPWYLRDYEGAGFVGRLDPSRQPIVIGRDTQEGMFLRNEDLISVPMLVAKLRSVDNPLSRYIRNKLSPDTVGLIDEPAFSAQHQKTISNALVDDFNRLIGDLSFYETEPFAGVSLRAQTRELLDTKPQGEDLIRLNRMLLEDGFPEEVSKNLLTTLGPHYRRIDSGLNPAGTYELRPGVNLVLYVQDDPAP